MGVFFKFHVKKLLRNVRCKMKRNYGGNPAQEYDLDE